MTRIVSRIMVVASVGLFVAAHVMAQEAKKLEETKKTEIKDSKCEGWDFDYLEESLEMGLQGLEEGLRGLEAGMAALQDIDLEINLEGLKESLQALGIALEHMEIPSIPPIVIPPIYVEIPPIESENFYWEWDGLDIGGDYEDLTEEEQLRLHTLSALSKMDANEVISVLEKILKEEEHPAIRGKALSILRNIDDERVVPILAGVAKNDPDIGLRKKAIYYLGKSRDERAMKVLVDILKN